MAAFDDFGLLVGRHYTSFPALSDTQPSEVILDSSGRLYIAGHWFAGTDSWSAGDSGVSALAVRNDAGGALAGVADGEYTPLQVDSDGNLRVNATVNVDSNSDYAEDSAHTSGDIGEFVLGIRVDDISADNSALTAGTNGDYQAFFTNSKGELYVKATDTDALLTDIDTVLDAIAVDIAAIEAELLDQGTTLDTIAGDTTSIDATLTGLSHNEDDAHTSGDAGIQALSVRIDDIDSPPAGTLAGTEGDYQSLHTNAKGELYVTDQAVLAELQSGIDVNLAPVGTEAYTVTDALAAGADGCETITAAATPWVDVATLDMGSVTTAYLYAYQWAASQNAQMRIISEDTVGGDIIIYKTDVNSSAMPGSSESWGDGGRIEIPGGANLELKMQIKKRNANGGDAQGTGSLHVRTV